ncbi:MAG: type II toxin-antitoxin system Phd/YefM family antitoxin [Leptospirales bacterium]
MRTVGIHQANTYFSRLLESVKNGEQVIITDAGPVAIRSLEIPEKQDRPAWAHEKQGLVDSRSLQRLHRRSFR